MNVLPPKPIPSPVAIDDTELDAALLGACGCGFRLARQGGKTTRSGLETERGRTVMDSPDALKAEIKTLLVANLMLQVAEDQLADDLPLFGPHGLGLDSVDALQVVVALDKQYGLKIADPEAAREILRDVSTIAAAVAAHTQASRQVATADG